MYKLHDLKVENRISTAHNEKNEWQKKIIRIKIACLKIVQTVERNRALSSCLAISSANE